MASPRENRRRAFADVVTIDAWHTPFGGKGKVTLHADVVFDVARIGGETESQIRFRLSVRRAEVILVIPDTEPVKVDIASVARDGAPIKGKSKKSLKQLGNMTASAKGAVSASPAGISAKASAEGSARVSFAQEETIDVSEDVTLMMVTQSKTADGHYRWTVLPRTDVVLSGRPWEAESPRAALIDERRGQTQIEPTVRVEVRCKREDLVIEDLHIKDETIWEKAQAKIGFKNRIAAAESYIRDRLIEEGLEVNNVHDPFGDIMLASVAAEMTAGST